MRGNPASHYFPRILLHEYIPLYTVAPVQKGVFDPTIHFSWMSLVNSLPLLSLEAAPPEINSTH